MKEKVKKIIAILLILPLLIILDCPNGRNRKFSRNRKYSKIKITTFNTRWLFNSIKGPWNTQKKVKAHIIKISNILQKLNSHIINLVEIENCFVLKKVLKYFKTNSKYDYYMRKGRDSYTGMRIFIKYRSKCWIDIKNKTNYFIEKN